MTSRRALPLLISLVLCASAGGETKLDVAWGWNTAARSGSWTLLLVTLSDSSARAVTVDVYAPHDASHASLVHEAMTIGPDARTFPIYFPIANYGWNDLTVTVRDGANHRKLAQHPDDFESSRASLAGMWDSGAFVGVSGRSPTLRALENQLPSGALHIGFLPPAALPTTPIGYAGLDLLILNAPDMNKIRPEQQQAIAEWVRAGGKLLMWPGDGPVPTTGALADILPCRVGPAVAGAIDAGALRSADLPARYAAIQIRELTPASDAQRIPLFAWDSPASGFNDSAARASSSGGPSAIAGRAGLGRVIVAPFDIGQLQFNEAAAVDRFWRPILHDMIDLPDPETASGSLYSSGTPDIHRKPQPYYPQMAPWVQREGQAIASVCDALGDVPGAGRFGFSYVSIVLIAMMLVVGPIDWLVLRKLGRQPWTWVTTTGWITLITLGAVYLGHLIKSGDLHFRTLRVITQIDGQSVKSTDVVGIYSPRSTDYHLRVDTDGWWEPAASMMYGRGGMVTDLAFRQNGEGSTPDVLPINVWTLRFLRGNRIGAGPAAIEASFTASPVPQDQTRIVGTLKNLTDRPLTGLRMRSSNGTLKLHVFPLTSAGAADRSQPTNEMAPQATVWIEASVVGSVQPPPRPAPMPGYYPGYLQSPAYGSLALAAADLDGPQAVRIDRLVEDGGFVSVIAEQHDPAPSATLQGGNALQKHWQFIHALVPLVAEKKG